MKKKTGFFKALAVTGVFAAAFVFTSAFTSASASPASQNISEDEIDDDAENGNVENGDAENNVPWLDDRSPDFELAETEREVIYDTMGGSVYYLDNDNKEIKLADGSVKDFYDTEIVKEIPYKLKVGGNYDSYKYVAKKGNQDASKGKVLKFRGWYTDKDYKHKYKENTITSGKNLHLYAKYLYDSDLTVPKTKYNKFQNSDSFKLGAKCSTDITYKSDNEKICKVNKLGKVTVNGAGTCTIDVKASLNEKYAGKTVKVTVNVGIKGPRGILKLISIHGDNGKGPYEGVNVHFDTVKNLSGYEIQVCDDEYFKKDHTYSIFVEGNRTVVKVTNYFNKKLITYRNTDFYYRVRGYCVRGDNKKKIYSDFADKPYKCYTYRLTDKMFYNQKIEANEKF